MQPNRLHHVQITVASADVDAARKFYCHTLGLPEIEKPDSLKAGGGFWLALGDQQIHVGVEDKSNQPTTKAHIAYQVDDLEAWRERLTAAGVTVNTAIPIPGYYRFQFRDPFGNRVEFIQPQNAPDRQVTYSGSPWEGRVGYARAVRVGDLIQVSGTTASTPEGDIIGETAAEQTRYIFQKIEQALEQLGASLKNVVRTRMFVTDISQWEDIGAVHHAFFADIHPAASMVEVSRLIDPACLIEIEVDAQL